MCEFLSGGASCFVYMNYSTCREPGGNISINYNGSNNFMWPPTAEQSVRTIKTWEKCLGKVTTREMSCFYSFYIKTTVAIVLMQRFLCWLVFLVCVNFEVLLFGTSPCCRFIHLPSLPSFQPVFWCFSHCQWFFVCLYLHLVCFIGLISGLDLLPVLVFLKLVISLKRFFFYLICLKFPHLGLNPCLPEFLAHNADNMKWPG